MSYLALYRKYRPSTFDELVGQDYIVNILKRSLKTDRLSHAYLFSGPRGTGKTSTAKLLDKLINCENLIDGNPCDQCNSCKLINEKNNPDIIEMDAASNNGVDEIRNIRDKVDLMPSVSKYKVFIIDEVHMLSTGAFNALLKTLEEPPKHVVFVLATTEFYKVPETIVSRCQCFEFSRVGYDYIVKKLKYIADKEKIKIDDETIGLIAKYSDGGLRDAIGFLDKLSCYSDNITKDDFYTLRGIVDIDLLRTLFDNIYSGSLEKTLNLYEELLKNGKNISLLAIDLLELTNNLIVDSIQGDSAKYDVKKLYEYVEILEKLVFDVKNFCNGKVIFEVALLKMIGLCDDKIISREIINDKKCDEKTEKVGSDAENVKNDKDMPNDSKLSVDERLENADGNYLDKERIIINNAFALANKSLLEELKLKWVDLSNYLHNREFSNVVSYLMDGTLRVAGDKDVIISVMYDSLVTNALMALDKIELLFNIVSGKHYNIAFVTDEDWKELKKDFIENKKNGKKYEYVLVEDKKGDIINSDDSLSLESESVVDAITLFGDDLVEVK